MCVYLISVSSVSINTSFNLFHILILSLSSPRSSWESIAFQPAEPGPDTKPQRPFGIAGCNDFYCSPELLKFVEATNVKISLSGHSLVNNAGHQYFGIRRIVVGGRYKHIIFNHKTHPIHRRKHFKLNSLLVLVDSCGFVAECLRHRDSNDNYRTL